MLKEDQGRLAPRARGHRTAEARGPRAWVSVWLGGGGRGRFFLQRITQIFFFFSIRILGSPAVSQMTCPLGSVGGSIYTPFSFLSARHPCRLPGHGVAGELPHAAGLCPHLYRMGIKNRFPFHTLCCYLPASEE